MSHPDQTILSAPQISPMCEPLDHPHQPQHTSRCFSCSCSLNLSSRPSTHWQRSICRSSRSWHMAASCWASSVCRAPGGKVFQGHSASHYLRPALSAPVNLGWMHQGAGHLTPPALSPATGPKTANSYSSPGVGIRLGGAFQPDQTNRRARHEPFLTPANSGTQGAKTLSRDKGFRGHGILNSCDL